MKTYFYGLLFATLLADGVLAQGFLRVKTEANESPIRIEQMSVRASVKGLYAAVDTEFVFRNPNGRVFEGELEFPLPDGATICGYAIDVNGVMVDGVVVEKEKARVVFETEARRGVDPGIVEHVKGNLYKTRIYPLLANKTRTVRISYTTPLTMSPNGDAALRLTMPKEKIGKRSITIEADTGSEIAPVLGGLGDKRFENAESIWRVSAEETDVEAAEDILISLPKLPKNMVLVEKDKEGVLWFLVSSPVPVSKQKASTSDSYEIYWDASSSREGDGLKLDYAFLEELPERAVYVLVVFSDTVQSERRFSSRTEMINAIKNVGYDGGTDFRFFAERKSTPGVAAMIFTDGLDTLGDEPLVNLPTVIVSSPVADVESLRQAAKGAVIDLRDMSAQDAMTLFLKPPLRITEIKGKGIADVQGLGRIPVGRACVIGKLTAPETDLVLCFGEAESGPCPVRVAQAREGETLRKAWAAMRVAQLAPRADSFADELVEIGRKYGVVSPATSLIVLERLDQWVRYDIEPPASLPELRNQWRIALKGRTTDEAAETKNHLAMIENLWKDRLEWLKRDFTKEPYQSDRVKQRSGRLTAGETQELLARGASASTNLVGREDDPIEHAMRRVHSELEIVNERARTLRDEINAKTQRLGQLTEQGATEAAENVRNEIAEKEQELARVNEEVVAYDAQLRRLSEEIQRLTLSDRVSASDARSVTAPAPSVASAGAVANAAEYSLGSASMEMEPAVAGDLAESASASTPASASSIAVTAWDPKTPYIDALKLAGEGGVYAEYLKQKKAFGGSPAFYLDCADNCFRSNQAELGTKILTNLAELKIEDAALLRVFAWRLRQEKQYELAVTQFRRIIKLRGEDPQSYRDLALTLAEWGKATHDAAKLEEAMALYAKVALTPWQRHADTICLFALEELNALISWIDSSEWGDGAKPRIPEFDAKLRENLSTDLRIMIAWDADNTDIDLHVVEPSGEEAFYSHNRTEHGGLVSRDITDGYGPEEYLISKSPQGEYAISVKFFASHQQTVFGPATVTATVFTDWGRANEKQQTLSLRLDKPEEKIPLGKVMFGKADGLGAIIPSSVLKNLVAGLEADDVEEILGKPTKTNGNLREYNIGGGSVIEVRYGKDGKLLRAERHFPGGAIMILAQ